MHAKFDFAFFDASDGVAVVGNLGKQGGFGGSKFHVHGESIAHPITRATSIASFFSLFSVVEIGRNKAPPPIF